MPHIPGFFVENFRVFKHSEVFNFSAINILTGTNNSGKSSLIKAMMLLKDNMQQDKMPSSINFGGHNHRLANFESVVNDKGKNCFSFGMPVNWGFQLLNNGNEFNEGWIAKLVYSKRKDSDKNVYLEKFCIYEKHSLLVLFEIVFNDKTVYNFNYIDIEEDTIKLKFNLPLILKINELFSRNINDPLAKRLVVGDYLHQSFYEETEDFYLSHKKSKNGNLHRFIGNNIHFKTNKLELFNDPIFIYRKLDESLALTDDEKQRICKIEKKAFENLANGTSSFCNNIDFVKLLSEKLDSLGFFHITNGVDQGRFNPNLFDNFIIKDHNDKISLFEFLYYEITCLLDSEFTGGEVSLDFRLYNQEKYFNENVNIRPLKLVEFENYINQFYNYFEKLFYECLSCTNSISSARISQSRIFNVNKSDADLMSRILSEIESLNLNDKEIEYFFLNYWISKLGIADNLIIESVEGVNARIFLLRNKRKFNIADYGFGSSQVLSILLQIAIQARRNREGNSLYMHSKSTIIIEEPEANLHPKLQSLLADMFIDAAIKFNIQFIIETHSEYLIRKLQYLTANKKHEYNIKPEDTAIYYFNDPKTLKKGEKQVRRINIRKDGILDGNFGPGFFDEASNLIMDILKISGSN
jgi:AAA15 family ATPase/GTPase